MIDVTTKVKNTAKMLGASGLASLNFGDACFVLVNNINQELKAKARQTILDTELLGRKFEDWLKDTHEKATHTKSDDIVLMNWAETRSQFNYGIVENVLQTLITKQFHDSRL